MLLLLVVVMRVLLVLSVAVGHVRRRREHPVGRGKAVGKRGHVLEK